MIGMLKGVNKRIIEVNRPDDRYFEKVIFFLNPQAEQDALAALRRSEEYLKSAGPKVRKKRRLKGCWKLLFQLTAAAAAGGILSVALTSLS
ncbi:hypothetical protein [Massiliimalia massiliensis]|uniref:hypothetical protein n=1 Tax=Massiliimalia massiliensis TaxID=1852384 RepID=UPI0013566EA9|nr:hypothetical protein [Massiliimalia massiliensis]